MANTLKFGNGEWYGKKDTILAYNDENNNYKPLPFNFSRGSSATVVNKDGLIETVGSGEPRIDYKDNSKGAFLLEPSRTNSFPYSENISVFTSASAGTGSNPTITSNYAISPEGTQNADRVQFNRGSGTTDSDTSYVTYGLSLGTIDATLSIYLKTNDGTTKDVTLRLGTSLFDYDVTVTSNWQRFTLSGNTNVDRVQILLYGHQNSQTADISCYGVQLEAGSYATSYIPTSGSAVTRLADSSSQTPPDGVIGQTEGTIFLDFVLNSVDGNLDFRFLLSGGNNTDNWIFVGMTNGDIRGYVNNTTNQFDSTFTGVVGTRYKLALAYKQNDFAFYSNGIQKSVSTSGTIPSLDRVILGNTLTSLNMVVKESVNQAQIYNTRLTNSELQALTTI